MSDTIDKLIDAKIVSGMEPLRGDIRQGIRELMEAHADAKIDSLLNSMTGKLINLFVKYDFKSRHEHSPDLAKQYALKAEAIRESAELVKEC